MRAGLSMDSCCEQTGRKAYLMELDPLYCDVIWQRWENFTGGKAKRIPGLKSAPAGAGVQETV